MRSFNFFSYTRLKMTKKKIVLQVFSLVVSVALKIQHFEFPNFNLARHGDSGRDKAVLVEKRSPLIVFST